MNIIFRTISNQQFFCWVLLYTLPMFKTGSQCKTLFSVHWMYPYTGMFVRLSMAKANFQWFPNQQTKDRSGLNFSAINLKFLQIVGHKAVYNMQKFRINSLKIKVSTNFLVQVAIQRTSQQWTTVFQQRFSDLAFLRTLQQRTTVFLVAIQRLANLEIRKSSVLAIVIHGNKSAIQRLVNLEKSSECPARHKSRP